MLSMVQILAIYFGTAKALCRGENGRIPIAELKTLVDVLVSTKTSAFIKLLTRNAGRLPKSFYRAKQLCHACPSSIQLRFIVLGMDALKQMNDFLADN
jgi:hypothetical protein